MPGDIIGNRHHDAVLVVRLPSFAMDDLTGVAGQGLRQMGCARKGIGREQELWL